MLNQELLEIGKVKDQLYITFDEKIIQFINMYTPRIIGATITILSGILIAYGTYKLVIYIFKKFRLINLIDRLTMVSIYKDEKEKEIGGGKAEKKKTPNNSINNSITETKFKKISDNLKIDVITAKSFSYYIFLVFFRFSITIIGVKEVEDFLAELLAYLPSLFIGVVIGFFGIRFANFVYDVIYYSLDLSGQENAEVIAMGGKIIILFFTLMAVLSKIGIAGNTTNIILIGFIAMLSLAGGLAFGLGGRDVAKNILESFEKNKKEK